jgi:hypothetical protein
MRKTGVYLAMWIPSGGNLPVKQAPSFNRDRAASGATEKQRPVAVEHDTIAACFESKTHMIR